jgi:hypothetical protein
VGTGGVFALVGGLILVVVFSIVLVARSERKRGEAVGAVAAVREGQDREKRAEARLVSVRVGPVLFDRLRRKRAGRSAP